VTVTITVTVTTNATSRCTRNKRIRNRKRERERNIKEDKSRGVPLTVASPIINSGGLLQVCIPKRVESLPERIAYI
jgi:hypothetical protein